MNNIPLSEEQSSNHSSQPKFLFLRFKSKSKLAKFVFIVASIAVIFVILLPIVFKMFVLEAYKIPSTNMMDTLKVGDRVLVNKLMYYYSPLQVGDIIVFRTKGIPEVYDPNKPYFIKRVVGLPGDELKITEEGRLKRNGKWLTEPRFFINNRYFTMRHNNKSEFTVPEGEVFVFGDNSRNSDDSRRWGGVPIDNVVGKVVVRYWPPNRFGAVTGVSTNPIE